MEPNQMTGNTVRARATLYDQTITTDISEEVTLPDYRPEIRRLLRTDAEVIPPDRFTDANRTEFSGTVEYRILYAGNDGGVYCYPVSVPYRFSVKGEVGAEFDRSEAPVVYALATAENVSARVTAPRRLHLKTSLSAHVHGFGTVLTGETFPGGVPEGTRVCRLYADTECAEVAYAEPADVTVSEELLPEGGTERLRVIEADGKVLVTAVEAGSGEVRCRGEVLLSVCACRESEPTEAAEDGDTVPSQTPTPWTVLTRKLPFSVTLDADGADVSCRAAAWGHCSEVAVTVEDGRILADVGVRVHAVCQKNATLTYTRDVFACGKKTATSHSEQKIPVALCVGNTNFTVGGSAGFEELGVRKDSTLVYTVCEPHAETVGIETENARFRPVVTGNARFFMLLCDPHGEYYTATAEFPFRYAGEDAPMPDGVGDASCDVEMQAVSCRGRFDGDRFATDAEIAVAYRMDGAKTVSFPETVHVGEEQTVPVGTVRICYPTAGETLWEVAKQYAVDPEALARENDLPAAARADAADSLGGVTYLVV